MIDIVTVIHNEKNRQLASELEQAIEEYESEDFTFYVHSNEVNNIGFGKGCNQGAFREGASAPFIGFINPDVIVHGSFIRRVERTLSLRNTVITGNRFEKPNHDLRIWGVNDWVCGATFFVRRDWFTSVGGFDPNYEWSFEETDLIRQAEKAGLKVRSIDLPLEHSSPEDDNFKDELYKKKHFEAGAKYFYRKWA